MTDATPEARRAIEAVWRIESARVIGALTRMVGDVGRAEDLAQDALVAALETWPAQGVPDEPGAWLMTVARRRAVDHLRRSERLDRKHDQLGHELEARRDMEASDPEDGIGDPVGDDVLRLMFMCCHPLLSREARVALTLRLPGGLTTREIARAFLVPVPTLAQRIVRAKRTLCEARVPFEVPSGDELAELTPDRPDVDGLVALMELQASRLGARVGPEGQAILLEDQDRSRWDRLHIRRGLAALERSGEVGGGLGRYALQAAIAACHARATSPEETDWQAIAALYDALAQVAPSPVVELNRAVAVGRAFGAEAGLEIVDGLVEDDALEGYHLLPAVRGYLLARLGRGREARSAFERAASLAGNDREREVLLRRAAEAGAG